MSVAGIFSSSLSAYNPQSIQGRMQQFQQEFQQLGQDLQSVNLSAAQSDFATLQQSGPQANSTTSAQSTDPIVQAFNQLSTDLKSGNTAAAQQDYATIQQDFQPGDAEPGGASPPSSSRGRRKPAECDQPDVPAVGPGSAVRPTVGGAAGLRLVAAGVPAVCRHQRSGCGAGRLQRERGFGKRLGGAPTPAAPQERSTNVKLAPLPGSGASRAISVYCSA